MDPGGFHPAWRPEEPWPATFAAPLSVDSSFEADAFLARLAGVLDASVEVLEFLPSSDERSPWSVVVRSPDRDAPVVVSLERTKRMDEVPPALAGPVARSRFTLIVESLLDPRDPRGDWAKLVRIATAHDDSIAVLDASTGRWFDRMEIDADILDTELGPPEDVLWRVQAVSTSEELGSGTVWLFTRGLLRCGLPELELLEVPGGEAVGASRLLDAVAALLLEDGPPAPEIPYAVGPGIDVALIPWQEAIETLDADSLGDDADRSALSQETPNPLRARRAAVCDIEPRGSFKRVWTWPVEAMAYFARADASIYRSEAATRRSSVIAQRGWSRAVEARDSRASDELVLLAGIPLGGEGEGRVEHAWIQVDAVTDAGGTGRMLRDSRDGRPAGATIEFRVADIDGWRLVRGDAAIGPEDRIDPMDFASGRESGGRS